MWLLKGGNAERKEVGNGSVAVAIDKDKRSQNALKWAVDHLLHRGQTVILIHVNLKPTLAFFTSPSLATPCNSLSLSFKLACAIGLSFILLHCSKWRIRMGVW
ncbi:hypothetical protein L1049_020814 [Liquidambar formosana]|uniref:UspA domain-containing protein n=1 Tax=Liquidambar formosana TaxID=63359 RepID=A0AAP0SEH5_LIQFO